jgi:hypothetical protein
LAITSDISTSYLTTDWTNIFYLRFWLKRPEYILYYGVAQYKQVADVQDVHRPSTPILFVLPPRSSELNGHVEKARRTHTEDANVTML